MDELENELFNSTLKRKNISDSSQISRKGSFQDFDEDDPLGDILSSSSETTPARKTTNHLLNKAESKDIEKLQAKEKTIESLFGLGEPEQVYDSSFGLGDLKSPLKSQDPSDWLGLKGDSEILMEGQTLKSQRESISDVLKSSSIPSKVEKAILDPSDGLTSTMNVDIITENHMSATSKKFHSGSVLEELLGKTATPSRKSNIAQNEQKKKDSILNSFILSDFDSKPTSLHNKEKSNESYSSTGIEGYAPSLGHNNRPRRSNPRKTNLINMPDPLGLFASSKTETETAQKTEADSSGNKIKVIPSVTTTAVSLHSSINKVDQKPSWLGGNPPGPLGHTTLTTSQPASSSEKDTSIAHLQPPITDSDVPVNEADVLKSLSNLELQVGEAAAQQQKSFISALALKKQEDLLLQLQNQHTTLLKQHEQQLTALVQRQFNRQKQMIHQQELIQAHIEALMIQPPPIAPITLPPTLFTAAEKPSSPIGMHPHMDKANTTEIENREKSEELRKLQSENADLKSTLASQRLRFDEQLQEMETMYRKSLNVYEETIRKQEARFLSEREDMEKETASRITRLKEEHIESSHQQAERMAELHSEWLADLRRLGEFHRQAVEMLRSEQTSTLEHWKKLQTAEIASIKEANEHSRLLQTAMSDLRESTSCLQQLRDQFGKDVQSEIEYKKDALLKQETHLSGLREILEKQAIALETERSRMDVLTQDLEKRLVKHRQDAEEDKRRYEAKEKEWVKEKASAVEYLEKEKQHLERLQSEARAELTQLEQQKKNLAQEVARLETTLHLQGINAARNHQQAEDMVVEARATLHAAQEAGREMEREREELIALKQDLQAEKQRLVTLEKELVLKQAQIQKETQQALAARNEGVSALEEARRLERERTEHASDLAQRLLYLKERENSLAKEKLGVTLEWKRIQEYRENATCVRCNQVASISSSTLKTSQDIIDPLPIIMKLEAEQASVDYAALNNSNYVPILLESISQ